MDQRKMLSTFRMQQALSIVAIYASKSQQTALHFPTKQTLKLALSIQIL